MFRSEIRTSNLRSVIRPKEGFSHGSCGSHFEAIGLKQPRKRQSDAVFIIDEQNSRSIALCGYEHRTSFDRRLPLARQRLEFPSRLLTLCPNVQKWEIEHRRDEIFHQQLR
jgi:hypothetical protein